jgi:hypothetical protein
LTVLGSIFRYRNPLKNYEKVENRNGIGNKTNISKELIIYNSVKSDLVYKEEEVNDTFTIVTNLQAELVQLFSRLQNGKDEVNF